MIATSDTPTGSSADASTEQFDPVACLSSRDRLRAVAGAPARRGRYIEVQGPEEALLIPLGEDVLHVGRGIAAGLHLDDSSVSHRHAIIVPTPSGAQILDDRSLNGTLVNGRRIDQVELHSGDVITIGRLELRYLQVGPWKRPARRRATRPGGVRPDRDCFRGSSRAGAPVR